MKLNPEQRVPLGEAKRRVLAYLAKHLRNGEYCIGASAIAIAIWPNHQMTSQGAGAAASRILKRMDGLVEWTSYENPTRWGWRLTRAGIQESLKERG